MPKQSYKEWIMDKMPDTPHCFSNVKPETLVQLAFDTEKCAFKVCITGEAPLVDLEPVVTCLEDIKKALACVPITQKEGEVFNVNLDLSDLIDAINGLPQINLVGLQRYCDKEGTTTGYALISQDEDSGDLTPIYLDANYQPLSAAPEGQPCSDALLLQQILACLKEIKEKQKSQPYFVEKLCDSVVGDNCELETCNIFSPATATSNATPFNVNTPITNHIDLSGLATPFGQGQDFVVYDPANQPHVTQWNGNETYLQLPGISAANPLTIDYDMGFVGTFNKIAIWNEEAHPANAFDVEYSLDGSTWTAAQSFTVGTNPITGGYGATVLEFDCAFSARYIRFSHTDSGTYRPEEDLIAIGEIAFGGVEGAVTGSLDQTEFYQAHTCDGIERYIINEAGEKVDYEVQGTIGPCPDASSTLLSNLIDSQTATTVAVNNLCAKLEIDEELCAEKIKVVEISRNTVISSIATGYAVRDQVTIGSVNTVITAIEGVKFTVKDAEGIEVGNTISKRTAVSEEDGSKPAVEGEK